MSSSDLNGLNGFNSDEQNETSAEEMRELERLQRVMIEGDRARTFLNSPEGIWFDSIVLKGLEDEAVETLKKGKTDEDRLRAQQMFLAAQKPRQILQNLVSQGEAAQQQVSTHQNGG